MSFHEAFLLICISWVFIGWVGVVILWAKCGFRNVLASGLNEPAAFLGPILAGFFFGPVLLFMVLYLEPSFEEEEDK